MIRGTMKKHLLLTNLILALPLLLLAQASKGALKQNSNHDRHLFVLENGAGTIPVCNLEIGKTYVLRINSYDATDYEPKIRAYNPKENTDFQHQLELLASEDCLEIEVSALAPDKSNGLLLQLSVGCKDCPAAAKPKSNMGIAVNQNSSAEDLIQEIFIGGNCFDVTDITSNGDDDSRGSFTTGMASIGIEEGMMLATGHVNNALGPNSSTNTVTDFFSNIPDPDLSALSGGDIYDYSAIEFDFVPTLDVITFDYVFASEEYCDYVGSDKNDVFGFFLSGPGINGPFQDNAINIATVPGTTDPVAINFVNYTTNAQYYVDNVPIGQTQLSFGCTPGEQNTEGTATDLIEYDGFTTVMTAVANVIPCETYHIKLAIADVNDGFFDSAVFLKANSFSAGGAIEASSGVTGSGATENEAYEGCGSGLFTFNRQGEDLTEPVNVEFSISPASTATEGVDFEPFPTEIIIPAGETSVTLTIDILSDALLEGSESIILNIENACACTSSELELLILDPPSFSSNPSQVEVCENTPVSITPDVSGGVPGYIYLWEDGSTNSELEVIPNGTSTYQVEVTDGCGQTEITTITVAGINLEASISGQASLCPGASTANVQVDFTGSGPWDFSYEVNGQVFTEINISENPYLLEVDQVGAYQLTEVFSNGCDGLVSGTATVGEVEISTSIEAIDLICEGTGEGSIDLEIIGGTAPYTYDWNNGFANTEDLSNLTAGNYEVLIMDANGCVVSAAQNIEEYSLQDVDLQIFAPLCEGDLGSITVGTPRTGVTPFVYSIDGGENFSGSTYFPGLESGNYDLMIQDANGCELQEVATVPQPNIVQVEVEPEIVIAFGDSVLIPTITNVQEAEIDSVLWSPAVDLSCPDCLRPFASPLETTDYRVELIDTNGCRDVTSLRIVVDRSRTVYVPNAFSPTNLDGINDKFMIYAKPGTVAQVKTLQVYNRWGQLVYEEAEFPPNDPGYGWDGMSRGKMLNPAVFVYFAEVELIDGTIEIVKGDVALVD